MAKERNGNAAHKSYKSGLLDGTGKEPAMYNLPHNNRVDNGGRKVRQQHILVKDKADPTKVTKKTIFHVNYSPYEQSRLHLIKEAIATGDEDILKKLTPTERKYYDMRVKEKEIEENPDGQNDN